MPLKLFGLFAFVLLGMGFVLRPTGAVAPTPTGMDRPNIILIVADDLGLYDLGCYGNDIIETPRLDAMAAAGLKFNAAYCAAPICSPSRAAIQTGLAPARTGMTEHLRGTPTPTDCQPVIAPRNAIRLAYAYRTIGEALQDQDYRTLYVGKWHLGGFAYGPLRHGYDVSLAAGGQGLPNSFFRPFFNGNPFPELNTTAAGDDYLTDAITTLALDALPTDDTPFFLNLNYYSPHVPIEGPPELVQKYEEILAPTNREFPNAEYAAMVETIDSQVGRLVDSLEARGLMENTIILFTSDHGALTVEEVAAFAENTPPTDSGPLRDGKGYIYEGGLRVPLIVYAPGRLSPAEINRPNSNVDYFPTITALAGNPETTPDGEVIPSITQTPDLDGQRTLYFHFPHYSPQRGMPAGAIIEGNEKYIDWYSDVDSSYYVNLEADPGEANPADGATVPRAQELRAKLEAWRDSVGARPAIPNPNFDPSNCN
ncbi:sulfatase [Lewinella sp. 4G2]|uniref:sulfatase n=1 Tax=Lewinella sp. 4G2 TaxID=1803372 RepID=UPI0007B4B77B|nr:sulfatase [Lewinella sp. 4G2]OAV44011.1 hypothetical protein A3850_005660 [Lewinella sp. 4G2]